MRPDSLVYGAVIGVVLALLISWMRGSPFTLRRPSVMNVVAGVIAAMLPFATEAIGLGWWTGILAGLIAALVVYGWRRLRTRPS